MKIKSFLKELEAEKKSLLRQLERVENVIKAIAGFGGKTTKAGKTKTGKKRNKMSAKGRAAIAAAQRARWAKIKAAKNK